MRDSLMVAMGRRVGLIFISCTIFLLTSCASRLYVGYNWVDGNTNALNNVSERVDADMADITKKTINAVQTYDITPLREFGAPKIVSATTDEVIAKINKQLKEAYVFEGGYEQWEIGTLMPSGLPHPGDNFNIYDFIEAQFTLKGNPGATIKIYVTKVNGIPKVCGFQVFPIKGNVNSDKTIGGLFPETIDKFQLFSKKRFGDVYQAK